jgi:putative phosphoesterase
MNGKIGLIADIHGNLVALDAVLAALAAERIDQIVCLGDVAVLGPEPDGVIARLREIDCPCVVGNTDAWLLADPAGGGPASTSSVGAELTRWCADRVAGADRAYLRTFQPKIGISLDNGLRLLCCHGSPRSYDEVIMATTPTAELEEMLAGHHASIVAGGHTHVQLLRRLGQGWVINPGSVGLPGASPGVPDLPVNRSVSWAEYAVVSVDGQQLRFDFRRLPIDVERVLAVGRASGMPHFDWWAGLWNTP